MSEMIGRLKIALNKTWQTHGQSGGLRAAPLSDSMSEALARAAIEAMRVPSEAMIAAGERAENLDVDFRGQVIRCWRAMHAAMMTENMD
mgnify:CR=1 FL=1